MPNKKLDFSTHKAKHRKALFEYQSQLNQVVTYEQFSLMEEASWDKGSHEAFVQAIDIVDFAPVRAVMREWLEGVVNLNTVPMPLNPHLTPAQVAQIKKEKSSQSTE